ncbi:UNVERIFIED_CONTAM: hypothetical protein GTU68_051195 [Idotea baltica]|nr:hypothetical protein [Idotea baltica]
MQEEMRRDERVFLMGEEVAEYNGAYKVSQVYQMSGGQFNVPIVFRGPSQSAGQLAATHSQSFENWFANCPGLKVVSCATPADGKGLLKSAIRDDDPVLVMESEQMYGWKGEVPEDPEFLDACKELAKDGIDAEMIDLRSLRPIDYDCIINSVKKTNRCIVVEESWPLGGFASELAYMIQRKAFDFMDAPVVRVTAEDTPLPYAPTLIEAWLPNPKKVIDAVKQVMYVH